MDFTYSEYVKLIQLLKYEGYKFATYDNYNSYDGGKVVIMRHDLDSSINKALYISRIEKKEEVNAIYFVMITSDFYNPFSIESREWLKEIMSNGGIIGLHFDEKVYEGLPFELLKQKAQDEKKLLEQVIESPVSFISMHRPSKYILEHDIKFDGMTNAYSELFFKKFKYVSDSRMNWREPVIDIVESGEYNRLQLLTHPFWYDDDTGSFEERLITFANKSIDETKRFLRREVSDLEGII